MSGTTKPDPIELLKVIAFTWLHLRQRGKKILADLKYDLTFEQIIVLQILDQEDGLQLGVLAERADRERTTTSRMVDGLEKRNLAVRVPDKYDKRQKLVYLTKLGEKRVEQLGPLVRDFVEIALKGVTRKQIETTSETLHVIIANAGDH
jgi:Transcriptional regulators